MTRDEPSLRSAPQSIYGREVLIELVSLHARICRRMPIVQALLAFAVGLYVLPHVPLMAYLAWCAISIGVECARARYAANVVRDAAAIDPIHAHFVFVLLAFAAGLTIGVGSFFALPRLPIIEQALLGITLFAIPAAGVAASQSSRYIVGAYSLAIVVPAAASWMLLHEAQALAVGTLSMLYCGFIILVAVEGDQLLLRSVIIRHERDRLVRDLEQRNEDVRAAMQRAEQAAQSRSRVLATASHDLRQPLHALSIYSAVLAANPEAAQLREVGTNIDQIVRSLGSLLHGLLDLSRLTAGHFVPDCKRIALDQVVDSVCAEYERPAAEKRLRLNRNLEPVQLFGDPVAIGRIVRNLLDNAIKYTNSGAVSVATRAYGEGGTAWAMVSVADTGAGIALAEQTRIFEEFYQLDNPGRDRSRGVGLGLAIVKRLCELIDADIAVESAPGRGTRFELTLRGVLGTPDLSNLAGVGAEASDIHGLGIYLIDDEPDILRSTRQLLELWGMRVMTADGVAAAEQLFEKHGRPQLLITDLRLRGEENGAQLVARLQRRWATFPSLIITGEVSAAAIRQAEAIGALLLYKPLTADALRRAISRAVDAWRGTVDGGVFDSSLSAKGA